MRIRQKNQAKQNAAPLLSHQQLICFGLTVGLLLLLLLETVFHLAYYFSHDRSWLWQHPIYAAYELFTMHGGYQYAPNARIVLRSDYPTRFLETDQYGFVSTGLGQDIADDDFLIVMLGGSTVEGRGATSNTETIPALVEKTLREKFPALKIRVVNAGYPGDIAFQELLRVQGKVSWLFSPKFLITLDGRNDGFNVASYAAHGWRPNWVSYFDEIEGDINRLLRDGGASPLGYIGRMLDRYSIITTLVKQRLFPRPPLYSFKQAGSVPDALIRQAAQAYIRNHVLLHALSRQLKAEHISFFQPVLLPEKKKIAPQEAGLMQEWERYYPQPGYWGSLARFYAEVSRQSDELPFFKDISALFKNRSEQLYHDSCHYTDLGNQLIAQAIVEELEPRISAKLPTG